MLSNCGAREDSWESLGQKDQIGQRWRTSTLNSHWKDWCWSWRSSTLATWWEEQTYWKRPWYWEKLRIGGEEGNESWHNITNSTDMNLSKLQKRAKDREARHAAAHGVTKLQTQLSNWTIKVWFEKAPLPLVNFFHYSINRIMHMCQYAKSQIHIRNT